MALVFNKYMHCLLVLNAFAILHGVTLLLCNDLRNILKFLEKDFETFTTRS